MAHQSPLREHHLLAEAAMLPYGPIDLAIELVETFGELDFEYAALRKAAALLDQPHRAVIEVTGRDRLPFLNNMLTQELKGLDPFHVRPSFWLNRKGRIDADLRVIELPDRTLLELDAHAVDRTLETLNAFIIAEDVHLTDLAERTHRLALQGPTGPILLAAVAQPLEGPAVADLAPDRACTLRIAGHDVIVHRHDSAGVPGLELTMPADAALPVYNQLIENGSPINGNGNNSGKPNRAAPDSLAAKVKLRPIGWLAYNTARIEAGTPLYNIDFGKDALPAETGEDTLHNRVNFKKGCYLGQEVVARMHSLGKPKHVLVALRPVGESRTPEGFPRQPLGGAQVYATPDTALDTPAAAPTDADPIGLVTSSTISPLLGGLPLCFAVLKTAHATEGALVSLPAEGAWIRARVQRTLRST